MWVWRHRYRGARRARGRRLRATSSKTAASRSASRCTTPTARSTATRSSRPCRGSSSPPTSASAAARRARCSRASSRTDGGSLLENDGVLAYVPYAARWPYEAHVVMREHRASLLECEPEELELLAAALQGARARLRRPVRATLSLRDGRPPGAHAHARRAARRARGTCTSSSTRRCARPTSSSTSPAPSRARARSSPTRCPRSPPPALREAIARAA